MFSFNWTVPTAALLPFFQYMVTLSMVKAVSLMDTKAGEALRIKWPNDLYTADGVKVGGVLCQSSWSSSANEFVVTTGLGLNVSNAAPTTCLQSMTGEDDSQISRELVLASYFNVFEQDML